ncbi:coiled-coil and C2 domain-containing protein 2A-like, partial [Myotis lucifugus]|uniref:coiled-coil and C2 domain-containing protein 2A-like n=1 Tax=Myotis lucifugus TaxID=59463 RepID=UPI0006D74687
EFIENYEDADVGRKKKTSKTQRQKGKKQVGSDKKHGPSPASAQAAGRLLSPRLLTVPPALLPPEWLCFAGSFPERSAAQATHCWPRGNGVRKAPRWQPAGACAGGSGP